MSSNIGKGLSFGIGRCLSYFGGQAAENRSKDEQEIDELRLQLDKIKIFYRCSRVKLIDLRQEIRLLHSLVSGEQDAFYQRRLDKFKKTHELTEGEVGKYKGQIDRIESRIEELKTPSFMRNSSTSQSTNNVADDFCLLKL